MQTISDESRIRIKYPFEIDNFSERYRTTNGIYNFTSPDMWVIDKFFYYLQKNSVIKQFNNSKYNYKPSYLSYDEYGVVTLGLLLMQVNRIYTIEDFHDLPRVIIPSLNAVSTVCQNKYPTNYNPNDVPEVNW